MTDRAPRAFFERARQEADRYGPGDWVFARELLQNARDAGATRVEIQTEERDGNSVVRCLDDGSGMTLAHAQRYLFSLYTSSKDGKPGQAGRFGVGFWSVLRFHPNRITIRSRTSSDAGFGICLNLDQNVAHEVPALKRVGTEITLERDGRPDGQLERRARDALKQNGRFLRTIDRATLEILVNGRKINERFALPAPSVAFEGKGFRGVVGLGAAPRIELFSRGLRVRSAAALDDLLSTQQTSHTRVVFPEMPDGLAPQAILDADNIELLLDRTEAREQKSLIRLVRNAEHQLARLVERQLALVHPEPLWLRLRRSAGVAFRKGAPVVTLLVVVVAGFMLAHRMTTPQTVETFRNTPVIRRPTPGTTSGTTFAYRDLARRYHGPRVDQLGSAEEELTTVALRYEPGDSTRHFAALRFLRFATDGDPEKPKTATLPAATPLPCEGDCLHVSLQILAEPGLLRIPLPTNHALAGPVAIDGVSQQVWDTDEGLPVLRLDRQTRGTLTYQTVLTRKTSIASRPPKMQGIPDEVQRAVAEEQRRPAAERVARMVALVRKHIRYDRSGAIAARHLQAQKEGTGFIERTFAIGAGDCDIQNAVLAVLLQQTGLQARLSAGYVGVNGQAAPLAHAWAEALLPDGQWRVADASLRSEQMAAANDSGLATDELSAQTPVESAPVESDSAAAEPTASAAAEPTASLPVARPPSRGSAANNDRNLPLYLMTVGISLLFASGLLWRFRPGGKPRFALDPDSNLPALIAAALAKPHLFRRFEGLFHHHLVPTLAGPDLSIDEARQLANRGRLYCATPANTLRDRRGLTGARVVDTADSIGARVAKHLGAIDLDAWQTVDAQLISHPLLTRVQDVFADLNVALRIGLYEHGTAPELGFTEGIAKLAPLANNHTKHETLVALDGRANWVKRLCSQFAGAPEETVFSLIDRLLPLLGLPRTVASALLAESAQRAVLAVEENPREADS